MLHQHVGTNATALKTPADRSSRPCVRARNVRFHPWHFKVLRGGVVIDLGVDAFCSFLFALLILLIVGVIASNSSAVVLDRNGRAWHDAEELLHGHRVVFLALRILRI